MVYRKPLFVILLLLALSPLAKAQDWEVGAWLGVTNYFGDLNNRTSFEFIGPGTGFFARYNINTRFANKLGFNYGAVSADDASSGDPYERARNLSFKSNILELTDQLEFNFFKYDKRRDKFNFTPYLYVGISFFYFNPKAELDGNTYALQPIGTEGQNDPSSGLKPYTRISWAIPAGGGFKYSFHPAWTLGVELGVRKTFTDYLDDVSTVYPNQVVSFEVSNSVAQALSDRSGEVGEAFGKPGKQRGNSLRKDAFMTFGLTLSYTILRERCPKPSNTY
ncbi:MAG: DUF6089 family protein [Chitinophagales bacterium]|nr:DUF6089 family protein [Chitinophagales bacterium]